MKFSTKYAAILAGLTFGMSSYTAFAQDGDNLVPNGSFESVEKKPKKLGSIESATGWASPTGVRADLFSGSSVPEIAVPSNALGTESAHEGGNYAGIVAFSYGNKVPRSYIMNKLTAPMKKDMRYCVKFYVSLAEASKYASNNMGINFSKKAFGTDAKVNIDAEPSIVHFNNDHKIISARYNWTEICGTYVAEGGERYITIGNFVSDDRTKNERVKKDPSIKVAQSISAYYYIDDISVTLLDKDGRCECEADDGGDDFSPTIYQTVLNVTEDMTPQQIVEAHSVFFAFGRDRISSEGERSLTTIAEHMKANPTFKLQIIGHNNEMEDSVGVENPFYADMDNKRIAAVMEFLKEAGVEEGRLLPLRKGATMPNEEVEETDDEDLRLAKSRRVTFKIKQ